MDAAISATPPLVKGQLARAAVVAAPQGRDLADSLSNKSPSQVGGLRGWKRGTGCPEDCRGEGSGWGGS